MTTIEKPEVNVDRVIAEVQDDGTVLVMDADGKVREHENVEAAEKAIKKAAAKGIGANEMRVTEVQWR